MAAQISSRGGHDEERRRREGVNVSCFASCVHGFVKVSRMLVTCVEYGRLVLSYCLYPVPCGFRKYTHAECALLFLFL